MLCFLIGQYNVKFKLIWEPVNTVIQTHGCAENREFFFETYKYFLTQAADLAGMELIIDDKITF